MMPTLSRVPRLLLAALLAAIFFIGGAGHAPAQDFPSKPIRVVVPFAPGGGTDNLMRILAPAISETLGQQVVIDNRPGGGAVIGTQFAANAAPDGYTLLASDSTYLINPGLIPDLPYDTLKAFAGVTMLAEGPAVLAVHPSVPASTLQELLALARQKPGQLSYASGGIGSQPHITGELIARKAGVKFVHVPYKGAAPAVNDLVGGQVNMVAAGLSSMKPYFVTGKLKAIAVTGDKRSGALPDVPTFAEAGLSGIDASNFWMLVAPTGTPLPIRIKIAEAVGRAMRTPALAARLAEFGFVTVANAPDAVDAQIRTMAAQWAAVVKDANIVVER